MYLFSVPVALQRTEEIQAATAAKSKIESIGPDIVVGFHALEFPSFLSDENIKKQLSNKRTVPIFEVHAPFEGEESILGNCKNLLKTLDVAKNFMNSTHLHVNYHVGVSFSNLDEIRNFSKNRREVYEKIVGNLGTLADRARDYNLQITLENIPSFAYKKDDFGRDSPMFFVFSTFDRTLQLVKEVGKNVRPLLDTCHWMIDQTLESKIKGTKYEKIMFEVLGIDDWKDFEATKEPWEKTVKRAYAYHLSNTTGPGINLAPELAKKWGLHGTLYGLLQKEHFKAVLDEMSKNKKHATIEVQQNPKTFAEPIEFARWIFG